MVMTLPLGAQLEGLQVSGFPSNPRAALLASELASWTPRGGGGGKLSGKHVGSIMPTGECWRQL